MTIHDTRKCEVGLTPAYKKKFEGVGRDLKEKNEARRNYRDNPIWDKGIFAKKGRK